MSSSARLRLASLDAGLRRAHLASRLRSSDLDVLMPELEQVLAQDHLGSVDARTLLLDLTEVLGSDAELRARVAEAATRRGLQALVRWLSTQRVANPRRPEPTLRSGDGRLLTLGEKKTLARLAPAELLPKLLLDVEMPVVARALAHPRLTEDILVSVMAKRPGSALLLAEIAKHARWVQRARVRVALLAHPATPLGTALLVVPLLLRQELELVSSLPRVAATVREATRTRLARLPPFDASPSPSDVPPDA